MRGAIHRVFHPGCKFEYMLCLVGGKGAGKSTFIRFLCGQDQWFTDIQCRTALFYGRCSATLSG